MGLWNPVGSKVAVAVCIWQLGELIQFIQSHLNVENKGTHTEYTKTMEKAKM